MATGDPYGLVETHRRWHVDDAAETEDTPVTIDVLANDSDPNGRQRCTVVEVYGAGRDGTPTAWLAAAGTVERYTPDAGRHRHAGDPPTPPSTPLHVRPVQARRVGAAHGTTGDATWT